MDQTKPARHLDPFDEAPDTRFYWSGAARSTPMAQVEAAIERGNLAIACAGAPGSGRTLFLYRLADHLGAAGARFLHPDRVVSCKAREPAEHVPGAWHGASARAADKGAAVLLLDDVDQLSRAEMAQLRDWWTALREKREKVALVVSCAASAVDPDSGARRQDLRGMIDTVAALQPLAPPDIEEVIRYRLRVAGCEWESVFTQPALEKIAFYAKGTPKRLVQICSRVMMLAQESGTFPAGPELVKEAAHQLFLPSHLREFSKKISLGLVPVPGSLNGSISEFSAALPSAADTVAARSAGPERSAAPERSATPEPRARLAGDHAPEWLQRHEAKPSDPVRRHDDAKLPDAIQHHDATRHDEAASARRQDKDDSKQKDVSGQSPGGQAAGPDIAPAGDKRRRLRGTVGVIAVCVMAIATGAIGYVLGQVDMRPAEVVRIIPQPGTVAPEDDTDDKPLPADNDGAAPASETAPPLEAAPVPEAVPVPEAAPVPETAPVAETADRMPTIAPPPPAVAPAPEVALEPGEPEPSKAFAGAEAAGDASGALADAIKTVREGQEAKIRELPFNPVPPPLARLQTSDGDDAGSDDDATAAGSGRTSTPAQDPEARHASSLAASAAGDEQEAAGKDRGRVGFAERGEPLTSVPAVKEPAVQLQRDPDVMRAQALLAQLDLYRGAIDGLLGERTVAAIRGFQKSMSIAETGKVNAPLLKALEERASAANSDVPDGQQEQDSDDAALEAAETLQVIDIMDECRGREAEWVYIMAINRHVLCGSLSAENPN